MQNPKESEDELKKNYIPEKNKQQENVKVEEEKIKSELKSKKKKTLTIILSTLFLLLILSGFIIITFITFKNNQKKRDFQKNIDITENEITAIYQTEQDKKLKLFNPESVGLTNDDYSIFIQNQNQNQRLLTENEKIKTNEYIPKQNGQIEIKIKFYKYLSSMNKLFKDCSELIFADITHLKTSHLENMSSAFEGCTGLKNIDFTDIDSSKVNSMDNLFNGCTNLIEANFSSLDMRNVKNSTNMFMNCSSIMSIDLSSFVLNNTKSGKDMFSGCDSLKNLDLSKFNKVDSELFGGEEKLIKINVKIKINIKIKSDLELSDIFSKFVTDILPDAQCQLGPNEKCKSCYESQYKRFYCESCNEGYYVPVIDFRKLKCLKCPYGCNECSDLNNSVNCSNCEEGWSLYDGKCYKNCIKGDKEKCLSCGKNENVTFCESCNEGYYLDEENDSSCTKCEIENCAKCSGNLEDHKCDSCENDYILSGNMCLKNCTIGLENNCKSCDDTPGKINLCSTCNPGYYLSSEGFCESCNIDNCTKCEYEFISNSTKCLTCEEGFLIENDTNTSICIKDNTTLPDRIDLIIKGHIVPGVIDTFQTYVKKTQNEDSLVYFSSGTYTAPSSSGWWKGFGPNQSMDVYFNFSELLEGKELPEGYVMEYKGSQKFTSNYGNMELMACSNPGLFWASDYSWGNNWIGNYGSGGFGIYYGLERSAHNGNIYAGGVFERSYTHWQLTGFTVRHGVAKGATNFRYQMNINAGTYSYVSGKYLTQTMTFTDLCLIKNTP